MVLLQDAAKVPTRATDGSAGYDVYSTKDVVVRAHSRTLVDTGVTIRIPVGHVGLLKSRSSLAWKRGLDVEAGVIDSDYRGEVKVLLHNATDTDATVAMGDRVAQLLVLRVALPTPVVVDALDETERGAGGFGSTGTA